jgi:hypothetical protein
LSARSTLSCLASLAFSSAWLCQDRPPSEGGMVLLKLGLRRGECCLLLSRRSLGCGQGLARLLQGLIPL